MEQRSPLTKIKVPGHHGLAAGDDLTGLMASMDSEGLRTPLLVDVDMTLIDGYRRLVAAGKLGWRDIAVMVPASYDDACEHLALANTGEPEHHVPITASRVWAAYKGLQGLLADRERERRQLRAGIPRSQPNPSPLPPARVLLQKSLGLSSEAYVNCVSRVFGDASRPGRYQRLAQSVRDRIVFEDWSPHSAYQWYVRRIQDLETKVLDAKGQANILGGAVPTLENLVSALDQVGSINPDLDPELARKWHDSYVAVRKALYLTQIKLNRHFNNATIKGEGNQ